MSRMLPAVAAILAAASVQMTGAARADVPSVAVDIAPVHSLVARVMKGVGEPHLIVPPGASPHGHALRPSEAQALQDADLVVWIGPDLTPWLTDSIGTLAPDARNLELLDLPGTVELGFRESALFEPHDHENEGEHEEEHADHDAGHAAPASQDPAAPDDHAAHDGEHDHHGGHDPHAWLDPENARLWLDAMATTLSDLDPEHADTYRANAEAGREELATLTDEITAMLDPVRNRNFIVFHDAYQYFETRFDFPASGAISLSDAVRPGPARVQEIHDRVADANVTCVLAEPQFNPDLVQTVLDGTDARPGVLDPLGSDLEPGAALYPTLLRNLARTLADCL